MMREEITDRFFGAWWGAFLGDAIAAPTHGYASQRLLAADYGKITDLVAPKPLHPESVLNTLPRPQLPAQFDYLGERRRVLWSKPNTHPHFGFQAGENTLPLYLAMHLAASVGDTPDRRFHLDTWMERYTAIMTTPNAHNDVFIPAIHRRYFENLAANKDPEQNGCPDAHLGDVAIFIPLMFGVLRDPGRMQMQLFRALKKFTVGEGASGSAYFLAEMLVNIIRGNTIEDTIYKTMNPDRHFSLAFPFRRWIKNNADEQAINATGRFAPLEESVPLALYLALKHHNDFLKAVCTNANLGGESTGRGAIIGMLVGAECGYAKLPHNMLSRLKFNAEIEALSQLLYDVVNSI